jgi:hypothetical protein
VLSKISNQAFQAVGGLLILLGLVLIVFSWPQFDSLPNYQRIGILVPALWGCALTCAGTFRHWESAGMYSRKFAVGTTLSAALHTIGSLLWLVLAPTTIG